MQKDLDEHARYKRKFGLYAMDLAFLSEFQCTTMDQTIEKNVLILQTKRRLKQIEKEAVKTKNGLIVAKKYVQFLFTLTLSLYPIAIGFKLNAFFSSLFVSICVTSSFVRNMQNDFKPVNDVDRELRDRNREIELFVEKKV